MHLSPFWTNHFASGGRKTQGTGAAHRDREAAWARRGTEAGPRSRTPGLSRPRGGRAGASASPRPCPTREEGGRTGWQRPTLASEKGWTVLRKNEENAQNASAADQKRRFPPRSQEAAGFRRHRLPAARSPQERCSVLPSATSSGRLVPPRVGTVRGEQCRAHSEDPARTRVPSGDHGGPVGASVVRLGRGCFPAVPEERRAVGRRSTGFLPGRQPLRQRGRPPQLFVCRSTRGGAGPGPGESIGRGCDGELPSREACGTLL